MIGYTMVGTQNLDRSLGFYAPIFSAMGWDECWRDAQSASWGDTGLCGAFAAVADDPFDATVGALALFGVAGTRTHESASGPGGFGWRFIDTLHGVMPAALDYEAEISEVETIAA